MQQAASSSHGKTSCRPPATVRHTGAKPARNQREMSAKNEILNHNINVISNRYIVQKKFPPKPPISGPEVGKKWEISGKKPEKITLPVLINNYFNMMAD
jgi:hypothetical protein